MIATIAKTFEKLRTNCKTESTPYKKVPLRLLLDRKNVQQPALILQRVPKFQSHDLSIKIGPHAWNECCNDSSPEKVCCCCSIFGRRNIKKQCCWQRWFYSPRSILRSLLLESWILVEQYLIMIVEFLNWTKIWGVQCLEAWKGPFRRCNFLDKRKKTYSLHTSWSFASWKKAVALLF